MPTDGRPGAQGPVLRLSLSGTMRAWSPGGIDRLPGRRRTRALLAILALRAPAGVSRSELAGLLWSTVPADQGRLALQQELTRLLEALDPIGPDVLDIGHDVVSLRPGRTWIDAISAAPETPAGSDTPPLSGLPLLEGFDSIDPAFTAWLGTQRRQRTDTRRPAGSPIHNRALRIGVASFQWPGAPDDADLGLGLGLSCQVTAALRTFRWLFVLDSFRKDPPTAPGVGHVPAGPAQGVDYMVTGTVDTSAGTPVCRCCLIDQADGRTVWQQAIAFPSGDLAAVPMEVAQAIVATLDPEAMLIDRARRPRPAAPAVAANGLMLRITPLLVQTGRDAYDRAGTLLDRLLAVAPEFSAAHAARAYWQLFMVAQRWSADVRRDLGLVGAHAARAIELDPCNAVALALAGHMESYFHRRTEPAAALFERAIDADPNLALAWHMSGMLHVYTGDWDQADRRLARYKELSPDHPQAFFFDTGFAQLALMRRDYEGAIVLGRAFSEANPAVSTVLKPYLAALGHLGRTREAALVRQRLLTLEPDFQVGRFMSLSPLRRAEDQQHLETGLRLAGLS